MSDIEQYNKLAAKITKVRKYAPSQPDILLCSQLLDICDAAEKWNLLLNDTTLGE